MGTIETSILLLVLLGACLVALILVLVARREAEAVREQARADVAELREQTSERVADVARRESALADKERAVRGDRDRLDELTGRLAARRDELDRASAELASAQQAFAQHEREALAALADTTVAEATAHLEARLLDEARHAARSQARRDEARILAESDDRARRIVASAVQRVALPTSTQAAVSVVGLPSPDLKGPVIGKDGRNIRAFEALTGVNVVIDDGSDDVVLSCFDAERREVAQVALEQLLADGRINLGRIEQAVAHASAETAGRAHTSGLDAAAAADVRGLAPELIELVGRLRLRTSAGQVVQTHLVESARIAAAIAGEIGADVDVARRAAFLHDIGKAVTDSSAGSHAAAGAELARRHGEAPSVVNAIAAHHDEVAVETVEGVIVQIADAISAARPGARHDDADGFVTRIEQLEELVGGQPGVRDVIVMSSGHEVRVIVAPEVVTDADVPATARTIAELVGDSGLVAGQTRVTVVRELRASHTIDRVTD